MRIVIKPLGVVILFVALGILSFLAIGKFTSHSKATETTASTATATATSASNLLPNLPYAVNGADALATYAVLPKSDLPGQADPAAPAIHFAITKITKDWWSVQTGNSVPTAIAPGEGLTLRVWARSSTSNPIYFVFEETKDPFTKSLNEKVTLTPEWKEYTFTFHSPAYPPMGSAVHFQVGVKPGTVDIADARLTAS